MTCLANGPCEHWLDSWPDRGHGGCRGHQASFAGDSRPWPCDALYAGLDGWCDGHRPVDAQDGPDALCVVCDVRLPHRRIAAHFAAEHPDVLAEYETVGVVEGPVVEPPTESMFDG